MQSGLSRPELSNAWIKQASENPRRTRDVLGALKLDGDGLQYVSPNGKLAAEQPATYRKFVMAAVRQNGRALRFASKALRDDEDVVVAAVAQDIRARGYASATLRGLTTHWMAPHNVAILPGGICRAKSWVFRRSELEVVDADPFSVRRKTAHQQLSTIDRLERVVGADLDGDGDIGEAGSRKLSQKAYKKRQKQIEALERERGVDLDGDGDIGVAGAALTVGTRVRDISLPSKHGERKAKFATPAIAASAIGTVIEVLAGDSASEVLDEDEDGWMYRVEYVDETPILTLLNQPACTREAAYEAYRSAAPEIQAMRHVAERAVAVNGCALKYAPRELRKDAELVKIAVDQNGYALRFAFGDHVADIQREVQGEERNDDVGQPNLKKDEKVVAAAIAKSVQSVATEVDTVDQGTGLTSVETVQQWVTSGANRGALRHADRATQKAFLERAKAEKRSRMRKAQERYSVESLRENGYALRYAPVEIQSNPEYVLAAVTNYGAALEFASAELQDDEVIVRAALRQSPYTLPITRDITSTTSGTVRWEGVEIVQTWEPDSTAWSMLPGSSTDPGGKMDPNDVFAKQAPQRDDAEEEDATDDGAMRNPMRDDDDDDDDDDDEVAGMRTVEIEDVLYYDEVLLDQNGNPVTETRGSPLTRASPLQTQKPVTDEAGNVKTEPAKDGNGLLIMGDDGKPMTYTVFAPCYRRVAKNWQVLKWASKRLQEDMGFLESVREDVRNDMHEILVHRRTAEKEVLMKAMNNSHIDLDKWTSEVAPLITAFNTMSDSRDGTYGSETRSERTTNDFEMAKAKCDLRRAQERRATAAMRHTDLELELAALHLSHIILKTHGPKCADWSAEAKEHLIADAEVPVAALKERFAMAQLKVSRATRRRRVAADKLKKRAQKHSDLQALLSKNGATLEDEDWSEDSSSSSSSDSSSDSDTEREAKLSKSLKKARKMRVKAERAARKAEKAAQKAVKSGTTEDLDRARLAGQRAALRAARADAAGRTPADGD